MTGQRAKKGSGRARLITATKDLLWECGFEKMSPADVLERSGVGQGSLYHHFDGKLDLARAALAEMVAEEQAAVDSLFAPAVPPKQRLSAYLGRERQALRGCRIGRLANETVMEIPDFRQAVAAYLNHVEARIAEAIAAGQAEGSFDPRMDAAAMGALFLSVIEGGYILARAHWDPARMTRALDGACAMLDRISIQ